MKKFFLAAMLICLALTFTACSTESSVTTETKVSFSTNDLQDSLDAGNKAYDAGKFDDAIKNFDKAIEIDNECIPAYTGRGIAYAAKNDFDTAIKDFDKTVKLDANYAEGYSNRGQAYAEKGDAQKALADFNKAIELDPKYATAYNNRGALFAKAGDTDKAVADFKKALELDPNDKTAAENLKKITS